MVVNETRRRLMRQLNSRYIYGKYVRHVRSECGPACENDGRSGAVTESFL